MDSEIEAGIEEVYANIEELYKFIEQGTNSELNKCINDVKYSISRLNKVIEMSGGKENIEDSNLIDSIEHAKNEAIKAIRDAQSQINQLQSKKRKLMPPKFYRFGKSVLQKTSISLKKLKKDLDYLKKKC